MSKASLTIMHPDSGGDGSALRLELFYQTDSAPGFIRVKFANQKNDVFDFDNGIVCDLVCQDVMNVVAFLGGKIKSLTEDEKPLAMANGAFFAMRKESDGRFTLAALHNNGIVSSQSKITLSVQEANGLRVSLEQSMFFLAFIKGVNP